MSATSIMQRHNPNAVSGWENGQFVFIEDWSDADGRMYRLEYRCNADGNRANAWCRYKPWSGTAGHAYAASHLSNGGLICIGPHTSVNASPYDLSYAIKRARFWCTGYSYLREKGYAAAKRDIPEW